MPLSAREMVEEVQAAFAKDATVTETRAIRALNLAQTRIAREPIHWPELQRKIAVPIVAQQDEYDLSALVADGGIHELFNFRLTWDTYRRRLTYTDPRD